MPLIPLTWAGVAKVAALVGLGGVALYGIDKTIDSAKGLVLVGGAVYGGYYVAKKAGVL